jgi:hypothetical protein
MHVIFFPLTDIYVSAKVYIINISFLTAYKNLQYKKIKNGNSLK